MPKLAGCRRRQAQHRRDAVAFRLSRHAAQHIIRARAAFGGFASLLDFCREVDRQLVSRRDLLLLIRLGAFSWTGLSRRWPARPSSLR